MTESVDIYRAAKILVDQHGDNAPTQALKRARELAVAGDADGASVLSLVAAACRELLKTDRGGSPLN